MQTLAGTRKNLIYFHLEWAALSRGKERITISGNTVRRKKKAQKPHTITITMPGQRRRQRRFCQ